MRSYNLVLLPTYLFLEIYASSAIAWTHKDFSCHLVYVRGETLRGKITSIAEIKTTQVNHMPQTSKHDGIKKKIDTILAVLLLCLNSWTENQHQSPMQEYGPSLERRKMSNKFYLSINCLAECQKESPVSSYLSCTGEPRPSIPDVHH